MRCTQRRAFCLAAVVMMNLGICQHALALPGVQQRPVSFLADSERDLYWTQQNCCGVVAAFVVCSELGVPVTLGDLELGIPVGKNGTSMLALAEYLRSRGMSAEGHRVSASGLAELLEQEENVRAIALVDDNHWVTVSAADRKGMLAVYSYPKWMNISVAEFERDYGGEVLLVGARGRTVCGVGGRARGRLTLASICIASIFAGICFCAVSSRRKGRYAQPRHSE